MKRLFEAYGRWRDGHPERHLSFVVFAALTVFALVAFPAQDLPVLVEHDMTFVDLSLALLAAGTAAALAAVARRGQASLHSIMAPTLVAAYKAIGGLGWPDWWQLALGPLVVARRRCRRPRSRAGRGAPTPPGRAAGCSRRRRRGRRGRRRLRREPHRRHHPWLHRRAADLPDVPWRPVLRERRVRGADPPLAAGDRSGARPGPRRGRGRRAPGRPAGRRWAAVRVGRDPIWRLGAR